MKIIQMIPNLYTGGAEKFCIELTNELAKNNEVILCTLFSITDDMFLAKNIDKNIKIISLDKKLGLDWKLLLKIYKLIRTEKPDVIHTHLSALFYSTFSVIFTKKKFFHTIHNIAQKETAPLYQKVYNILFNKFNVTPISISDIVLESVQQRYGKKHTTKIDNGVKKLQTTDALEKVQTEIETLKNNKDTKVFINIARIIPQKNQEMLVKVFNKLITEEKKNVILLIIGEDPTPTQEYYNKIKENSVQGIHFLGLRGNIADYLHYSDAFCLSSNYEGLPITLLEAMSTNCLTISTPVGGIPDVITHKENGILSTEVSESAYHEAITLFLNMNQSEKKEIREKATQDFNTKYTMEACAKKYYNIYQV